MTLAPGSNGGQPGPNFRGSFSNITDSPEFYEALLKKQRRSHAIRLSTEQEEELVERIIQDVQNATSSNREFRKNHRQYIRNWRSVPEPVTNSPLGEQAANIKTPLTPTFIEQWKARFAAILLSDSKITNLETLSDALATEGLKETNDWFNWELRNIVCIDEAAEDIFHYTVLDGIALPIPYYSIEEKTLFSSREFLLDENFSIADQIEAAIRQSFDTEDVEDIVQKESLVNFTVTFARSDKPAELTALIDNETLVLEWEREEIVFDGVKTVVPNIEDVILQNSHHDVEQIPFIAFREWILGGRFKELAKSEFKRLSNDEVEEILSTAGPKTPDVVPQDNTEEFDLEEGADSTEQNQGYSNRQWVEIYHWEGFLNDKNRTGVAVWVSPRSKKLLKVLRLEELNKDGLRSPVKFEFIRAPGRFYAVGLGEWVRNVQTEIDGIHNFRLDSALIATVPFGFYEPATGFKGEIIDLRAGKMYPTKNAKGIVFPNMQWNPIWGFQEEGLVRKYASELAGIGDIGAGTFASKRVTATEAAGIAGSIDIRTKYIAGPILRQFKTLLTRIFGLYQQHAKTGRVYQVVGSNGENIVKRLERDRLNGKMLIVPTGTLEKLSSQLERDLSVNMLSLLLNQLLISMGIVQPDTIYGAIKRVAEAFNYKGVPLHAPPTSQDSPPPYEEHQAMMLGREVEPHMGEDFNTHIPTHMKEFNDPAFTTKWPDVRSRQLLYEHIRKSMELQAQVSYLRQQQAAQAAQMSTTMERLGIRPGAEGDTSAGANLGPGSQEEGIPTAAPEQLGSQ